jgi:hypothetical protein
LWYGSLTDDLKLRFTLDTAQGFSRFSPQVRGQLGVHGWTDEDELPNVEAHLDVRRTTSRT